MLERQKVDGSLCDKVIIFADGSITIDGLIEVSQVDSVIQNGDIYHYKN